MCSNSPFFLFFFFNDTATTEIYTLSLHDALPICPSPSELYHPLNILLLREPGPCCPCYRHAARTVSDSWDASRTRRSQRCEARGSGLRHSQILDLQMILQGRLGLRAAIRCQ